MNTDMLSKHHTYVAGASTFSKSPYRFPQEYPNFISKAKDCYVWDINGKKYIDYVSALGAITLGYNHKEVNRDVKEQIDKGNLFSLCSDIEADCARILTESTNTEKCMFVKTGTDATNAAVRLAKAFTGRDDVAICKGHYHGWGDWFGISQDIHKGINDELYWNIKTFEYNNIESLKSILDEDIAAVIMEPITYSNPSDGYMEEVERVTHNNGSILITDEIVSYPRFGNHMDCWLSGNSYTADIKCIGKGIANGYSISAVVGREDILDQRTKEEVFISGTFFGEAIGMAATIKTIEIFNDNKTNEHIWKTGVELRDGFNKIASEKEVPIIMSGLPPRMILKYSDNSIKSLFLQETANQGLIFGNIIYPTLSHTQSVIEETLEKCDYALDVVASAIEQNIVEEAIIGRKCRDLQLRK